MRLRADEDECGTYPYDRAARIAPAPHGNVEGHIPMRWAGGWRVMDGSKMLKEIREQPEVLGRVLDEGWGEVSAAARELRSRGFRSGC